MLELIGIVLVGFLIAGLVCFVLLIILVRIKFTQFFWLSFGSSKVREWLQVLKKISWRDYLESLLRASSGSALERPFGTPQHFFRWNKIQFKPVYLSTKPLEQDAVIQTEVTLGPKAAKPLLLKIPVLLGGISYGNAFSLKAIIGLAKAASSAGTAVNCGNGPFLQEIREVADKFILQLPRGYWSRSEAILKQADMIELGLGHAAWASAPIRIKGSKVNVEFAGRVGSISGLDLLIDSRLPEVENFTDLKLLVEDLKRISGGVPIACKMGCTHFIEQEMEQMIAAGVDVIVFDGTEAGTHGSPPTIQDNMGLPLLPGLCRAVNYLEKTKQKKMVSLVVGGGLFTPGDFLKCLALGADAVIIGTIASLALVHTQVTKTLPWEPPTEILYFDGKMEQKFDPVQAGRRLQNELLGCVEEMKTLVRAMGKRSFQELNKRDLVALDPLYAKIAEIEYLDRK